MSDYQSLKVLLVDLFGISKDSFHIILGFLTFLLFSYLMKLKPSSFKLLLIPLIFAFILEFIDFRDEIALNLPLDVNDALHDVFFTMLLPTITVVYFRIAHFRNK